MGTSSRADSTPRQELPARNRRIELCLSIPEDEPAVAGREVNIPHRGRAVRTRREQDRRHQDVLADEELVVEVLVDCRVLRIVEEQRARDRQARPRPFVHCVVVELEHAVAQLDEPAADARHRFAVGVHLLVFLVVAEVVVAEPGQERAELHPADEQLWIGDAADHPAVAHDRRRRRTVGYRACREAADVGSGDRHA